jgi:hypothetical protein
LAYKNTPFPKQYTILSNKWGAVQKKVGLFLCPKGGGYANGIQNATLAKIDEAGEKLQNIRSSVENVGKKFLPVTAAASSNANTNVSMMGETFKYCAPIASALGFSAEDP